MKPCSCVRDRYLNEGYFYVYFLLKKPLDMTAETPCPYINSFYTNTNKFNLKWNFHDMKHFYMAIPHITLWNNVFKIEQISVHYVINTRVVMSDITAVFTTFHIIAFYLGDSTARFAYQNLPKNKSGFTQIISDLRTYRSDCSCKKLMFPKWILFWWVISHKVIDLQFICMVVTFEIYDSTNN